MTMPNIDEHSRRDDMLIQNMTSTMLAQTETIKALTASVDALREKVHSMETLMAENGARDRGRVDNLTDRVTRLEKVNQVVVGAIASIVAGIIIFLFQNVLKTGIGVK